jgi:hypothetical protein
MTFAIDTNASTIDPQVEYPTAHSALIEDEIYICESHVVAGSIRMLHFGCHLRGLMLTVYETEHHGCRFHCKPVRE